MGNVTQILRILMARLERLDLVQFRDYDDKRIEGLIELWAEHAVRLDRAHIAGERMALPAFLTINSGSASLWPCGTGGIPFSTNASSG